MTIVGTDTMRDRFTAVASDLLERDPRIAVVLADIGTDRFANSGAAKRYPGRYVNVGIREQALVGFAAGMAFEGFRPIVHTYAPFLMERAFEQIKLDFCHQGVAGIFVSAGASYDAAASGRTHQAPEDVALMGTLPGMTVHVPGHPDEAERMLRHEATTDGNAYIRLADSSNAKPFEGELGRFGVVRASTAPTAIVIAVGPMLDRALAATAGLELAVLYASTVRPWDAAALRSVAAAASDASGAVKVLLVEPYLEGTSAAEVASALDRPHRLLAIGVPRGEYRRYGTPADHDAMHGLDEAGIRARIGAWLA